MTQPDWLVEVEKEKETIRTWDIKDRLSLVAKLAFMNSSFASSVEGWNTWLNNTLLMNQLREEELRELTSEFEKLSIAFLDLDIKYTKLVKERQRMEKAQKLKEKREEAETEERKKTTYVA